MKLHLSLFILLLVSLIVENPLQAHAMPACYLFQVPQISDMSGHPINGSVKRGQQIQIIANMNNCQDKNQTFAYIVQIQDSNGVELFLSWLIGNMAPYQLIKPIQSWLPTASGTYTVQIFFWSSLTNPDALQAPASGQIVVQ